MSNQIAGLFQSQQADSIGGNAAYSAGNSFSSKTGWVPAAATGLQTAAPLVAGIAQARSDRANAAVMGQEGSIAATQGFEQEAQQRRAGTMALGREKAALGAAGAGYGGSAGRAVRQSALNTELDALNIRYKSQLQRWAYASQGQNLKYEGGMALAGGAMKAGAALLRGYSGNYVGDFG